MSRLLYLDQNAWIALARGAWDRTAYPEEHAALATLIDAINTNRLVVALSFANIYETMKINDLARRVNMARTQSIISGGTVYRGRRRILEVTLRSFLSEQFNIPYVGLRPNWFLSDIWIDFAADYSPENFGEEFSKKVLEAITARPSETLFDFLAFNDEEVRIEGIRRYSAGSSELIATIENRRALVAGEPMATRKRAYGARQTIDEIDFFIKIGRSLGLDWNDVGDIGSSLIRSLVLNVPIMNCERELAVRLEDQARDIEPNDLQDMSAFTTALPFADIVVGEKQFVNLAKQARLGERYSTDLFTSILDFVQTM